MRLSFSFLALLLFPLATFAQPKAKNFPNMAVYQASESDPYVEVFFTGSVKRFENKMSQKFRDSSDKPCAINTTEKGLMYGPIKVPAYSMSAYTIEQETVSQTKVGSIFRFRIPAKLGAFNMLDIRLGVFRSFIAQLQEAIDETNRTSFFDTDQAPNTFYVYEPEGLNKNLASYLFYYSKDPVDTSMKKLTEWFVLACEERQAGTWIEPNTFRIDNLRQPAFGSADTYSLTIEHSIVQDDYHQYVIYLSNYKAGDVENNYQVRPHDLHIRLWHYYTTLLTIEKLGH